MGVLLIMSNFPDRASAERCGHRLVKDKLAACVNVLSPCLSVYTWKGEVETAEETPLLIKAPAENFPMIQEAIRSDHAYELPEIIGVAIDSGLPEYLAWVRDVSQVARPSTK